MIEELNINYDAIADKLTENIIESLEAGGHVRTGNLVESITSTANEDGISMEAEEYFQYVDEKYVILEDSVNDDLSDFAAENLGTQMEEELGNQLQDILSNE